MLKIIKYFLYYRVKGRLCLEFGEVLEVVLINVYIFLLRKWKFKREKFVEELLGYFMLKLEVRSSILVYIYFNNNDNLII